jgi:hypothetical protein
MRARLLGAHDKRRLRDVGRHAEAIAAGVRSGVALAMESDACVLNDLR